MPPKGWRKNGDGVQPNKDLELVSIDDILFPRSTIQKLAKAILSPDHGDSMSLTKDSLIAVQRSATVFVSHLMYHARQVAKDADRKNMNSHDILVALERADLNGFVPEVKQQISTFESNEELKKKHRAVVRPEPAGDEPAAKKMKDNNEATLVPTAHDDDDDAQDLDDDATDEADANDADMPDDDDETPAANPIALLNQEQHELEGTEPAEADNADETDDE